MHLGLLLLRCIYIDGRVRVSKVYIRTVSLCAAKRWVMKHQAMAMAIRTRPPSGDRLLPVR